MLFHCSLLLSPPLFLSKVDAMWVESMNSVMDDNKILTLINGDRIPLTGPMSLVFEIEDMSVASPATVSRAGMIYMDQAEMGWWPYVTSWMQKQWPESTEHHEFFKALFTKLVEPLLAWKELECHEPVPITDFEAVRSLCVLFTSLHTEANGLVGADGVSLSSATSAEYPKLCEKWFVFSLMWSAMACVDEKGRVDCDGWLRENGAGAFPPPGKIHDYYVDMTRGGEW
jgi:dynein heavy chain